MRHVAHEQLDEIASAWRVVDRWLEQRQVSNLMRVLNAESASPRCLSA